MKNFFADISGLKIGGEPVIHIIWCVLLIIVALLLKKALAKLITHILSYIAKYFSDDKYRATFKNVLQRPLELLVTTILFYIALNQLTVLLNTVIFSRLGEEGNVKYMVRFIDAVDKIFLFFVIVFLTLLLSRVLDFIFHILIQKAMDDKNDDREQLFPLLKDVTKILLWTIGIFWILGSVFSVNIPALITGLGIGGIAIALAAKESVENFFASFTILTDKPFKTGDNIKIDKYEGTVEKVGFRSTRIRSVEGSLYIIPNKNLIGNNLENLSERNTRRIKITLNIQYGIAYDQVKEMIAIIKDMLKAIDYLTTPQDVILDAFNENSFVVIVVYHLPNPLAAGLSLNQIKHDINMQLYATIDKYIPNGIQK